MHVFPRDPDDLDEQALGEAVLAHDAGGHQATRFRQLEVAVALDGHQAVTLHAGHRLRHSGAGLAQPLGDARAQRDDVLLFELEDRPEVHLRGVDEVAHGAASLWVGGALSWAPGTPVFKVILA